MDPKLLEDGPLGSLELMDPLSWGAEVLLTGLIFWLEEEAFSA